MVSFTPQVSAVSSPTAFNPSSCKVLVCVCRHRWISSCQEFPASKMFQVCGSPPWRTERIGHRPEAVGVKYKYASVYSKRMLLSIRAILENKSAFGTALNLATHTMLKLPFVSNFEYARSWGIPPSSLHFMTSKYRNRPVRRRTSTNVTATCINPSFFNVILNVKRADGHLVNPSISSIIISHHKATRLQILGSDIAVKILPKLNSFNA